MRDNYVGIIIPIIIETNVYTFRFCHIMYQQNLKKYILNLNKKNSKRTYI